VPTKERNVQSMFLTYRDEGILFDCGEGTQRQMNICGINRNKIKRILITHWHGDHVAGLVSLLQTIGHQMDVKNDPDQKDKHTLHIYGPEGTKERMHHLMRAIAKEFRKIEVKIIELPMKPHLFWENEWFALHCAPMRHSTPCLGYAFIEKDRRRMDMKKAEAFGLRGGRKIGLLQKGETVEHKGETVTPEMVSWVQEGKKFTLIPDTKICNEAVALAEDADILVTEATYRKEHEERAHKFKHLTSEEAASIAQRAGAKKLILTHFSQRYPDLTPHLEEAKIIHHDTVLAYDFMKIEF